MTITTMRLSKLDLEVIQDIVLENKLASFELISDNSSGIGCTLDLQFECEMSGRAATLRISVRGTEEW